jgi:hypothetical protein
MTSLPGALPVSADMRHFNRFSAGITRQALIARIPIDFSVSYDILWASANAVITNNFRQAYIGPACDHRF